MLDLEKRFVKSRCGRAILVQNVQSTFDLNTVSITLINCYCTMEVIPTPIWTFGRLWIQCIFVCRDKRELFCLFSSAGVTIVITGSQSSKKPFESALKIVRWIVTGFDLIIRSSAPLYWDVDRRSIPSFCSTDVWNDITLATASIVAVVLFIACIISLGLQLCMVGIRAGPIRSYTSTLYHRTSALSILDLTALHGNHACLEPQKETE